MRGGLCVQLTGTCVQVHLPPLSGPLAPHLWCTGPRSGLSLSWAGLGPRFQNSSNSHQSSEISCTVTREKREAGSEGRGPGTQRLGLLKVP